MIASRSNLDRLVRDRDSLVWRIITTAVLPHERVLAVDLVADAFYDRLLSALESDSFFELIAWVDQTCETYREFPQIGSMLAGGCRAVLTELEGAESNAFDVMPQLRAAEHSLHSVAFKPRARYDATRQALDEVDVLIASLVARLGVRDPLTAEHSLAVSAWCARIGRRMSLSESELTYVTRCGHIHDVGKIEVPLDVLQAPRSLTEAEWEIMRGHSTAGEEIVRACKPLRNLAPTVRSHHERLDGRGYPDALGASQIPLATRIVSVADAFNAMIGRRPYRLPMSPANALERLVDARGTQFDPMVVEALIWVVEHAGSHTGPAAPGY